MKIPGFDGEITTPFTTSEIVVTGSAPPVGVIAVNRADPSNVLNGVAPGSLDPGQWLESPDLSAVAGHPPRYWKLTGDVLSLMTAEEQAAVDDQILAEAKSKKQDALFAAYDQYQTDFFSGPAFAQIALAKIHPAQDVREAAGAIEQWITALFIEYDVVRKGAVNSAMSLEEVEAVSDDYSTLGSPPFSIQMLNYLMITNS